MAASANAGAGMDGNDDERTSDDERAALRPGLAVILSRAKHDR